MTVSVDRKLNILFTSLAQKPVIFLFVFSFCIQLGLTVILSLISKSPPSHFQGFEDAKSEFIMAVIIAPVFETAIFQYAILISVFDQLKSPSIAILVSALAFGFIHFYSTEFVIIMSLSGILFGSMYMIMKIGKNRPFLFVLILHLSINLFVFMMKKLNA